MRQEESEKRGDAKQWKKAGDAGIGRKVRTTKIQLKECLIRLKSL